MPASIYCDMNANSGLEDQRALQLAFELSLLGINGDEDNNSTSGLSAEDQRKRSANMTECVPVPSSEHVAEIVGRQGCKIKALRAKTNTYIKTPVRGEEPVFVVTGRREDVLAAKREILSAAEHFSQIRASRRNSSVSSGSSNGSTITPGPPSPTAPGQVTIQVRVPYRVVGLVVGPKGATIKRIQQQTHTYIVTPSRDKEPVFEVTGLPENVEKARQEIESHIAMRTGGHVEREDDFQSNGIDSGFHELNGDLLSSMYAKSPNGSANFHQFNGSLNNNFLSRNNETTVFNFPPVNGSTKISDFAPIPTNGYKCFNRFNIYDNDEGIGSPSLDPMTSSPPLWPELDNRNPLVSFFGNTSTSSTVSMPRRSSSLGGSSTPGLSPTLSDTPTTSCNSNGSSINGNSSGLSTSPSDHPIVRRIRSDPHAGLAPFGALPNSSFATTSSASESTTTITSVSPPADSPVNGIPSPMSLPVGRPQRNCFVCSESEVVAALVPCGHNLFCMECASLILEKPPSERLCPVCQQTTSQAIRIFS